MIREMIMPQLGMGMSEGTIAEWAVKEGDRIAREQQLLSVETEKVVTELPSPYAGFVHLLVEPGTTVPVETPIARIADTEEEYRSLLGATPAAAQEAVAAAVTTQEEAPPTRALARGRVRASGLAKKIARENAIDLATVVGSGPVGRIVRRDVMALLERVAKGAAATAAQVATTTAPSSGMREKARIQMTGMRRTIAERMAKSKNVAPHTHIFFEIDVTKLEAVRQTLQAREKDIGARISMTAIHARVLALACRHVPICNAALIDGEIVLWDEVNIGIGVALPGRNEYDSGLVVPVVRNVESKGLLQIDSEIRDLVARARAGTLSAADMANGTITISSSERLNKGCVSLVGTPLLSLPQVVAYGPGAAVHKPVLRDDGQIVPGYVMPCCLTFDHRAMDGEPAARLVGKISDFLRDPELMLL